MSQKHRNIIQSYYYFFDHKLKNTTVIVGLIGMMVVLIGLFLGETHKDILDTSIHASVLDLSAEHVIDIGGQIYTIELTKK